MEFHFRLRPLEAALDYPDGLVSWFTLSDGWYWITVGDHELLRQPSGEGVDYYVDNFWEDVLSFAPDVLRPVPADLVPFVESRPEAWAQSERDAAWTAEMWHSSRKLFVGYLAQPPMIRGWRVVSDGRDEVTIAWYHEPGSTDVWADEPEGRVTVPTETFRAAVRDFDARWRAAMLDRTSELERNYPEIAAEKQAGLAQEVKRHTSMLERRLAKPPEPEIADLDLVRAGAAELLAT
ncbi:MAG TPA: DUF5984 family protein [Actinoplanes sp.]